MKVTRIADQTSSAGPEEYFTGRVRIDGQVKAEAPGRVAVATVTFEPGARTAWHTHPAGQTLIITDGIGLVQKDGEAIQRVTPGDRVWFPAGEKHWHGASPDRAMSHIAIQEAIDGSPVEWMEKVTDEDYRG